MSSPDDGDPDPGLRQVLASYDRDECSDEAVLAALTCARLVVPVTPLPMDRTAGSGAKSVEMALPVMIGTDGRRALPAFSCVAALAAWDPTARPVPVDAARAAAGALQERCDFLVLDPAGPVTWVADVGQVRRLARPRPDAAP